MKATSAKPKGRAFSADRRATRGAFKIEDDPEAMFQEGWLLCDVGEHALGLEYLRRAVDKNYFVVTTLEQRPQFDALRDNDEFKAIVAKAASGRERALNAFRDAGGERLLGS